uniref:Latent-transforming growth factor beta-binding protein 1 n=1 Tax=Oncorhynchus kisutch TaxID=8019 RepID=A0A8C7KJ75_ONCKI
MDTRLTRLSLPSLFFLMVCCASRLAVGNHTGRIKVVFTPTICKVTCTGGRCQNNCELGNTTTIVSENGHAADTLTAPNFRVVVCHLPCMNGGKCSARDKCQCPPTFTGKFCQMPVQNGNGQQRQNGQQQTSQIHSTHTLPLTFSNGQNPVKYAPSIVNIHVKHPPEASVQIHQVSQLDANGQKVKGNGQNGHSQTQSHYTYHHSESSQKIQHYVPQYQPVSNSQLGRCFQETTGTQCGKALPGLSKQEECCQSIGTSWGFHKCQKCPKPSGGSRQAMDCPQGYKRINNSHCQDLNECQLQGVCPNGDCLNTMGSYRCSCKAGFIPDPTLSTCIPDTPAVHEEKGACFRLVSSGKQCLHPVPAQLSKQLCCCSVGKAWGPRCDKCPLPGTAKFKEICPGGMGYTVTGSYKPKLPNQLPKLPSQPETINKPMITHQEPVAPPLPFPTPEKPVEALSVTERQLPSIPGESTSHNSLYTRGVNITQFPLYQLSQHDTIPSIPEVVEKTSPPAPALILPSNAGQDIAPTQSAEVDECQVNPHICGQGICYNTVEGYTCICREGYQMDETHTTCVDVDECLESASLCSNGRCRNTPGSFLCVCQPGFMTDEEGTSCIDLNECLNSHACPEDGFCVNNVGSYICRHCDSGFRMSPTGQCEDIDECLDMGVCPSGMCVNLLGSYECDSCPDGFQGQGGQCVDVDECLHQSTCANGKCSNFEGYFVCSCNDGFTLSLDGQSCEDVDECQDEQVCTRGHCQNTVGSYLCNCGPGFRASPAGDQCDVCACVCVLPALRAVPVVADVDECQELTMPCDRVGQCVNNMGSYHCSCPQGYQQINGTNVDECLDDPELCSPHGECLNAEGSFYCVCERGFAAGQDTHTCEDVNECELLSGVCGEALCENVEGSFLCMCPDEDQEYNQMTGFRSQSSTLTWAPLERKECYYNLNDENLCENVLTSSVTMEECCCTLGAGWGDNCEVHPCPVQGTGEEMCPAGRGNVPTGDAVFGVTAAESYKDADECALFGQEICKDGFCLNSPGSYECYCKTGLYYDEVKLQCRDIDECQDESSCVGGECLNTQGSYMCFCTRPMVLDSDNKRCVIAPEVAGKNPQRTDYQGICWQTVTGTRKTCTKPLANRKTTFTECCCLHGEAWGMDCALCPLKNTEDYASMCNVPMREGQGHPYGRDALVLIPCPRPAVAYDAFEGLRAEECGILNGCENGRCVRVQEGYTCDCFDGYTLDMSRMACVDVNECSELNNRMSLCKNAKCINTEGSYKCVCLPGYTPSEQPNYCVAREPEAAAAAHTERE